ncbi:MULTISPECIES: pilus assembly protein TadG-related protein [unclassified Pseudovibrio]|uniref:pilus assembly protein TadG-related protein n=1 Tax=unclassified Pseudovibrio TaxID=2627060 RepID=UPI0007B2267C|nr:MULTISPECIES: pilus assembly protein TadG-related protein [unclassified Pseudovibrio]KZK93783.1 hypothetical protein PsW74_05137 [Pseudovibrio sp. W74]KZL12106.1 hypothetical protein PsAD14_00272 [Pseudovibrio sp. Ad14]
MGYFRQFSTLFKRFNRSEDGMVAVLVAVLMVLMIVFAGMAIDFGMGFNTRRAVNQALDAAVLAVANKLSTTELSKSDVELLVEQYFKANIKNSIGSDAIHTKPVVSYDPNGDTISATASATVKNNFSPLISLLNTGAEGLEELTVSSSSSARFPKTKVEVAVVVDVTGSMSGSIGTLKTASRDMLNTLLPEDDDKLKSRVRISYVPYNVGVKLDWQLAAKATFNRNQYGCVHARIGDETATGKSHNYEDEEDDERVDYIGTHYGWCPNAKMVPLTSERSKIESSINVLRASSATAGQIGIAWGWYTLSPLWKDFWPSDSKPDEYGKNGVRKYAVLMTDGSFNTYYSADYGNAENELKEIIKNRGDRKNDHDQMYSGKLEIEDHEKIASKVKWDYRSNSSLSGVPFTTAKKLCRNMKEEGIVIYTVFFGSNYNGKKIMQECASTSKTFYHATNKSDLIKAFSSIANDIKNIYLSQ